MIVAGADEHWQSGEDGLGTRGGRRRLAVVGGLELGGQLVGVQPRPHRQERAVLGGLELARQRVVRHLPTDVVLEQRRQRLGVLPQEVVLAPELLGDFELLLRARRFLLFCNTNEKLPTDENCSPKIPSLQKRYSSNAFASS